MNKKDLYTKWIKDSKRRKPTNYLAKRLQEKLLKIK